MIELVLRHTDCCCVILNSIDQWIDKEYSLNLSYFPVFAKSFWKVFNSSIHLPPLELNLNLFSTHNIILLKKKGLNMHSHSLMHSYMHFDIIMKNLQKKIHAFIYVLSHYHEKKNYQKRISCIHIYSFISSWKKLQK